MKYWDEINIREAMKKQAKKKFYFLDGPPYVNGHPHMGHARTRAIRDPILKYRGMRGYDVWLQPGYDCHGLPIEVKVESELGLRTKDDIYDYGTEKFIDKCRERALHFVGIFNDFWKRFGMHWDFEKPYKTLDDSYIDSSWAFFKKAKEKGLLYKGKATTAWCPRCETALAGYEATDEYRDVQDTSIFVKFPIEKDKFFVIWTTTPWTLPSNLAIAANPKYEYSEVSVNKETWVMAKDLVEKVMETAGEEKFKITKILKGKELEGIKYEFVLSEEVPANKELEKNKNVHTVILADYVTLEDGTGLVHIAPGHGQEDYSAGMKYGLPVFSPVGPNGRYTEEGGMFKGTFVRDADERVIQLLRAKKLLLAEEEIWHRYAHCWRCKTPIIYLASPQWFIAIEKIKGKLLEENAKVNWIPDWAGAKRFQNWIEQARDWCISRQRFWGIPLPIWECECGHFEVIGSFEELKKKAVEAPKEQFDLHVAYVNKFKLKCPECGKKMSRVPDITDIWFESGASTWASVSYPGKKEPFGSLFPADFITEGLDQTRGWFYTLMCEGVIMFDQSPYKTVLMNDWVLDKDGNKMSKSLGNVTDPKEVIDKYGADICRFYLLHETQVWDKLKFNSENVRITYRLFNTWWNCYQFLKTYGGEEHKKGKLKIEDEWILSRLNTLMKEVTDNFENYLLFESATLLNDFITNDFSRWYVKLIRDRTWVSSKGEDKETALYVMHQVLLRLTKLMAPFAPFLSEHMYRELTGKKSVFLDGWPEPGDMDKDLEEGMKHVMNISEAVNAARNEAGIKLRWPLAHAKVVIGGHSEKLLKPLLGIISQMTNVRKVDLSSGVERTLKPVPNFRSLGPKFGKDANKVANILKSQDGNKLKHSLDKGKCKVEGFEITKEDVSFTEDMPEDLVGEEFEGGVVYLETKRPKELVDEGYLRDMMRQIQELRKKDGLHVADEIQLEVYCSEEEFSRYLKSNSSELAKGVSASKVSVISQPPKDLKEEFMLDGKKLMINYTVS